MRVVFFEDPHGRRRMASNWWKVQMEVLWLGRAVGVKQPLLGIGVPQKYWGFLGTSDSTCRRGLFFCKGGLCVWIDSKYPDSPALLYFWICGENSLHLVQLEFAVVIFSWWKHCTLSRFYHAEECVVWGQGSIILVTYVLMCASRRNGWRGLGMAPCAGGSYLLKLPMASDSSRKLLSCAWPDWPAMEKTWTK